MTYELSLEYGSYPVKEINAFLENRTEVPDFLKNDSELLEKLDHMNNLFHDLFLTIECTFHYIGHEYPDKIAELKVLYQEVTEYLEKNYPDHDIVIERFIL